ncbi:putative methyltransferase DDB_G0268948 [Ylistrum balloti]|uniref:putative methyltransferase DDB_G0268948 n=1 Tax=Ylistrum balloti TaxID=509963 RepID=UPI002905A1EA|nr:putative methyltransferase DDB_G0268948 [Ylistrum balloti]
MSTAKSSEFRLFEGKEHAKLYAKYRPSYPERLYRRIKEYCMESDANTLNLAVDVGCGSGQSTLPLTSICKHVIGVDISKEQITAARKVSSNVDFREGHAEELGFQGDETVDLVTTATAIHWMDIPTLMKEVSRVLRPGGVLAVYSFIDDKIHNNEAHQIVWEEFYHTTLRECWTEKRKHIANGLAMVELPFKETLRERLDVERHIDIESYVGYLSSMSSWQTYQKKNPDTTVLSDLLRRLRSLYKDPDSGVVRPMSLTSHIILLLGRKPNLTEYNNTVNLTRV